MTHLLAVQVSPPSVLRMKRRCWEGLHSNALSEAWKASPRYLLPPWLNASREELLAYLRVLVP